MCAQSIVRLQKAVTSAANSGRPAASSTNDSNSYSSDDVSSDSRSHFACPFLQHLVAYLKAREQGRAAGAEHLQDNVQSPAVAFLVADVAAGSNNGRGGGTAGNSSSTADQASSTALPALRECLELDAAPCASTAAKGIMNIECYEIKASLEGVLLLLLVCSRLWLPVM